jgi:peptidyl-prolyl cis-trans isomerase B (cyclophilin B)
MSRFTRLWNWAIAGGLAGALAFGCNQSSPPTDQAAGTANATAAGVSPMETAPVDAAPALDFNQSFDDAVITEVLEGHQLPPDLTFAGKKTAPLRAEIESLWPRIRLTDANNHPIVRRLNFATSSGAFEIELRPELAPNHVRNMLALAALGYYDGLLFERNVHQDASADLPSRIDLLIGGCPTGTGEDGFGHLGYFLRSEAQPELKHVEGTVGFWHEEDPDSAGCRFYITLSPCSALDGKFTVIGRVSKGIDVLKGIAAQPVQSNDSTSPDNEKPVHPAVIQKVTISPEVSR